MKKLLILIWIFVFLFAISSVSAVDSSFLFKKDTVVDLKISCFDEDNNYCGVSTNCQLTINYPNSSNLVKNGSMTYNDNYFNYTLTPANTGAIGEHYTVVTCQGNNSAYSTFTYEVTPTGTNPSVAQGIIYIILIIANMIILILCISGAWNMDGANKFTMGGDILEVNYGKYVKLGLFFASYLFLIFLTFLCWQVSANFLYIGFMATIFRMLFITLEIFLAPFFIAFVVVALIKWTMDLKLWKLKVRGLKPR